MPDLKTKDIAEILGATTRQIIYWTDKGALRAIPGTLGAGHGSRRLYAAEYVPEAAIVGEIAKYRIPVSSLVLWAELIGVLIAHGEHKSLRYARLVEWYRRAMAGEIETYITLRDGADGFAWRDQEEVIRFITTNHSEIVINVRQVIERANKIAANLA